MTMLKLVVLGGCEVVVVVGRGLYISHKISSLSSPTNILSAFVFFNVLFLHMQF